MTRTPSRTFGAWTLRIWTVGLLSLMCALLMTACQTTDTSSMPDSGSKSEGGEIRENEGGFKSSEPKASDPMPKAVKQASLRPVFFAFDRSDLTPDARASLREDAEMLRESTGSLTLAGHTDERGTFEYNLALGDRRANVVKKYLVALGVQASRIRTKSYGEAEPAVMGHDESAWKENRRVTPQD